MIKKLILLTVLFLLLIGLAVVFVGRSRPAAGNINPLQKVSENKLRKIIVARGGASVTLEKEQDRWEITAPLQDWTDPDKARRLVQTVLGFSIGSLISSNKERYDQFRIQSNQAVHLQVFIDEQKPILDGYVGKAAEDISSSYFRFSETEPVYIANGLAVFALQPFPSNTRLKKIFGAELEEPDRFEFTLEKARLELVRSSATWTRSDNGYVIPLNAIFELTLKLKKLRSDQFPSDELTGPPYLIVTVEGGDKKTTLTVGSIQEKGEFRFARMEGRPVTLLIKGSHLQEITSQVKKLASSTQ